LKTLLFAIFSMCFALSVVVALSQDAPNQALKTPAEMGARLTTIMGTVQEDGEKLRFVTEQRAWNVDNPETLKGHQGHYVHAEGYAYPLQLSRHRSAHIRFPNSNNLADLESKCLPQAAEGPILVACS
jgi:hypothetical protein